MTTFGQLFGQVLLRGSTYDDVSPEYHISTDELEGKTIGLYFFSVQYSASYSQVTSQLAEVYKKIDHEMSNKFDIVFISTDVSQPDFENCYQTMPWKALPFSERDRCNNIQTRYKIDEIPCLIVLSSSGELITTKGIDAMIESDGQCVQKWIEVAEKNDPKPPQQGDTDEDSTSESAAKSETSIDTSLQSVMDITDDDAIDHDTIAAGDDTRRMITPCRTPTLQEILPGSQLGDGRCSSDSSLSSASTHSGLSIQNKAHQSGQGSEGEPTVTYSRGAADQAEDINKESLAEITAPMVIARSNSAQSYEENQHNEAGSSSTFGMLAKGSSSGEQHAVAGYTADVFASEVSASTAQSNREGYYEETQHNEAGSSSTVGMLAKGSSSGEQHAVAGYTADVFTSEVSASTAQSNREGYYEETQHNEAGSSSTVGMLAKSSSSAGQHAVAGYMEGVSTSEASASTTESHLEEHCEETQYSEERDSRAGERREVAGFSQHSDEAIVLTSATHAQERNSAFSGIVVAQNAGGLAGSNDTTRNSEVKGQSGALMALVKVESSSFEKNHTKLAEVSGASTILKGSTAANGTHESDVGDEGGISTGLPRSEAEKPIPTVISDIRSSTEKEDNEKTPLVNSDPSLPVAGDRVKRSKPFGKNLPWLCCLICSCLALLFLILLILCLWWKRCIGDCKSMALVEKTADMHEIFFEAMFSTNYIATNEYEMLTIKNTADLTSQLNGILPGNRIRVLRAFFHNESIFQLDQCQDLLQGESLQMNVIFSLTNQCPYENDTCMLELRKKLENQFFNTSITVEWIDSHSNVIYAKLCSLSPIAEQMAKEAKTSASRSEDPTCSLNHAKMALIILTGQDNSEIRDQNQYHGNVTLYESSVYVLRIRLDCVKQSQSDCNLSYDINAWIDFNDDENFDDFENRVHPHVLIPGKEQDGFHNFEISTPKLDGVKTKVGQHRMSLNIKPNVGNRKICNNQDFSETREYTVNIIPKPIVPSSMMGMLMCSSTPGKIILVLIGGEQETYIRDETADIDSVSIRFENVQQSSSSLTMYGETLYLMRVQLDCPRSDSNCNLAHHVNVFIDLNDDGQFDEFENRVYSRTPIDSKSIKHGYDIQILIPTIDGIHTKIGSHRMQINVMRSEAYRRGCSDIGFSEKREYIIDVVPKVICADRTRTKHCLPNNLICSTGDVALFSIELSGDQNTRIQDSMTRCSARNNFEDQTHMTVKLSTKMTYKLQIRLHCVESWNMEHQCDVSHYINVWLDLNNDGQFDDKQEQILQSSNRIHGTIKQDYTLSISIPKVNERPYNGKPHRMRVVLARDEKTCKPCYNHGHGEARDYTIYIS